MQTLTLCHGPWLDKENNIAILFIHNIILIKMTSLKINFITINFIAANIYKNEMFFFHFFLIEW